MLKALARMFRRNEAAPAASSNAPAVTSAEQVARLFAETQAALADGATERATEKLQSMLETHPDLAEAHFLMGIVQHRQRDAEEARDSFLLASSIRPDWWAPHFELGLLALDESNFDSAAASLEKALELGAKDARVHNALGSAYVYLDRLSDAVEQFYEALALEPDSAEAHSNLGYVLFRDMEEYEQGARHIQRALELAPDHVGTLCNWVMVLQRTGREAEALQLANQLLSGDPNMAQVRANRALILLERGEFAAAWADYEARKQVDRNASTSDYPAPEWDGSSLGGHSIFVYAEQGLGDHIMFASCIPDLMKIAGAVTIECNAKLEKIFRRSFPDAAIVAERAWRDSRSLAGQPADYKVAIGSLPLFFRRSRADFPAHAGYLRADPARVERWRAELARLPGHRKVGISWRGGLASTRRSIRSISLEQWAPVLTVPDIDFVSLQYGGVAKEIDRFCESTGSRVQHWEEAIADYDETAALVSALDLVISVQTAVVHLAGALGKTTWALLPSLPEWRYGSEDHTMLWYPAVNLVRQLQPGAWDAVMHEVRERLTAGSYEISK
jgi:tetratricopeptide (TPR) repeat protein